MKASFSLRLLSLFFLISFSTQKGLTQFENTIGNLVGTNETTDIKPLPNDHSIVLANTTSFGAQKILLIELDPAGLTVFFKTIFDLNNPTVPYTGNSLELDLDAAGNPSGYFITGCKGNYPTQMVLIRTDLNGNPTWSIQMDNVPDPNSAISECGISLERQSNRDVVVVGRSDLIGDLRFTVSRISNTGAVVWSNRYGSTTGLQFIPNESCNGKRGREDAVTVIGHIHDAGIGHTYMSCIRASNGIEFWRQQYDSHHFHDDGTDVVQNDVSLRYFAEGHAEELTSGTKLWTFVVNPMNGNMLNGATYSAVAPLHNLFGRDICLNSNDGTVAITGFCDIVTSSGVSQIRTFLMNIPFLAGAVPNWSHYFSDSDPQLFLLADDAVEFIGGPNPGYLIGTQAKLPGAALLDYDVHALRVNSLGVHNLLDCPDIPFATDIQREGSSVNLKRNKTESTWSTLTLGAFDQDYIEDPCIGPIAPPNIVDLAPRSDGFMEPVMYPNPAFTGSDIYVEINLPKSADVGLQLLDMTGKLYGEWKFRKRSGAQQLTLTLPSALTNDLYLLKLNMEGAPSHIFKLLIQ